MSNRHPGVAALGSYGVIRAILRVGPAKRCSLHVHTSASDLPHENCIKDYRFVISGFQIPDPMFDTDVKAHIGAHNNAQPAPNGEVVTSCMGAGGVEISVGTHRLRGMTIIEIVIVLAILGILASIGIPLFNDYRFHTMVAQAKSDITDMDYLIAQYQADNGGNLPDSLGDIGKAGMFDPWGNSYGYLNLVTLKGNGHARKDKNLVPLNSDYDLYSKGKDGQSVGPLTAKASRDDIIRASNGRFIGLASDY